MVVRCTCRSKRSGRCTRRATTGTPMLSVTMQSLTPWRAPSPLCHLRRAAVASPTRARTLRRESRSTRMRPSLMRLRISSPSSARRAGSSDAVGSSIRSTRGSTASARAIATRCASPPDSFRGSAAARCSTPKEVQQLVARGVRRRSVATPYACTGARQTLSSADRCSNRQWNWNTMPTLRLSARRVATGAGPLSSVTSSTATCPAWNGSRPAMARSIVVLPEPDGPIIATSSPRLASRRHAVENPAGRRD